MGQVQVITGVERRRRWSVEQKRTIVMAAFAPGAVVTDVARRADVCGSQIYRWRRELAAEQAGFAEVVVLPDRATPAPSVIEVELGDRARLRIPISAPPDLAAAVLAALVRR
jgi:transposase